MKQIMCIIWIRALILYTSSVKIKRTDLNYVLPSKHYVKVHYPDLLHNVTTANVNNSNVEFPLAQQNE